MTWGRRIRLYLTGFGLGLIIVYFFFFRGGNRDLGGWLPNSRVVNFIASVKKLDVDSALLCKMKCNGFTIDDVRKAVVKGDVDFDKSQPHKDPCHEYDVKMNVKGRAMEIYFSACMQDSTAKILLFNPALSGDNCGCR